jgi:quinoprotein relay system zinc metallohydrolase 2
MKALPYRATIGCRWCSALFALLVTIGQPAFARDVCTTLDEIAPGVHVRQGRHDLAFTETAIANVGFIVGQQCVAAIDSGGSPREGEALACALRRITDVPLCYLILTHVHPDHWLGSTALIEPNTRIIGHDRLPRALALVGGFYLQRLAEQRGTEPDPGLLIEPDITVPVDRPLELNLGERVLRIQAHPPAHTDTDLTVHDMTTETLWLSDLVFMEHVPVVDASSRGWLSVLDDLTGQSARRAVPGHGPASAAWPRAAADTGRYLRVVREQTRVWLDAGGDMESAQDEVGQGERERWQLFDAFHKRNVIKIYTELEWE